MKMLVVELAKLRGNIQKIVNAMGDVPVIGVCKANGYGMGLVPFARELLLGGVSTLAVATIEEAKALREAGIDGEIILLSSTSLPQDILDILELRLTAAIGSVRAMELLDVAAQEAGQVVRVHLKLDTGFGRFGFVPGEEELIRVALKPLGNIRIIGTFSHLSNGFGGENDIDTPFEQFRKMVKNLNEMGVDTGMCHLANSCAAIKHPRTRLDAVRIGSAFIGRLPMKQSLGLEKLGYFSCPITELHKLRQGETTGYSRVYRAKQERSTAVISAGVSDGLHVARLPDGDRLQDKLRYIWKAVKNAFRQTTLQGQLNGKEVRCIGLLGMSSSVLDVTNVECRVGDICTFDVNPILVDSSVPREYV